MSLPASDTPTPASSMVDDALKEGLDQGALQAAVENDLLAQLQQLPTGEGPRPASAPSGNEELLEEIAEDMLQLSRRLNVLEQGMLQLSTRLDQIDARVYESSRTIGQQVELLRRDLIGDRSGLLARSLFTGIVSHIDSMVATRQSIAGSKEANDKGNKRLIRQLEALELSLLTALQSIGFHQFRVEVGEPFVASRMEAVGFAEGEPGVVLSALSPGFETKDGVMRRAGVMIAKVSSIS